jgi:glycosyltransferase involved in cell wall biosynthesis
MVVVYDNGSTDGTAAIALAAGAHVSSVPELGKGNAVRAAVSEFCGDVLIFIDGDATYDPADAPALVAPILDGSADMVVGERMTRATARAFKPFRRAANRAITRAVDALLGIRNRDVLSGYRALSREFAGRLELDSTGFEIEVELLSEARRLGARVAEIPASYDARDDESSSKLIPVADALRILSTAWRKRPRR